MRASNIMRPGFTRLVLHPHSMPGPTCQARPQGAQGPASRACLMLPLLPLAPA